MGELFASVSFNAEEATSISDVVFDIAIEGDGVAPTLSWVPGDYLAGAFQTWKKTATPGTALLRVYCPRKNTAVIDVYTTTLVQEDEQEELRPNTVFAIARPSVPYSSPNILSYTKAGVSIYHLMDSVFADQSSVILDPTVYIQKLGRFGHSRIEAIVFNGSLIERLKYPYDSPSCAVLHATVFRDVHGDIINRPTYNHQTGEFTSDVACYGGIMVRYTVECVEFELYYKGVPGPYVQPATAALTPEQKQQESAYENVTVLAICNAIGAVATTTCTKKKTVLKLTAFSEARPSSGPSNPNKSTGKPDPEKSAAKDKETKWKSEHNPDGSPKNDINNGGGPSGPPGDGEVGSTSSGGDSSSGGTDSDPASDRYLPDISWSYSWTRVDTDIYGNSTVTEGVESGTTKGNSLVVIYTSMLGISVSEVAASGDYVYQDPADGRWDLISRSKISTITTNIPGFSPLTVTVSIQGGTFGNREQIMNLGGSATGQRAATATFVGATRQWYINLTNPGLTGSASGRASFY